LISATRINASNQGINNRCVLEQTYTYNGTSQITINEIGLMYKDNRVADEAYMTLVAREVLDSPITVSNGDTFTVSMIIG
jgi:hypothetical protein